MAAQNLPDSQPTVARRWVFSPSDHIGCIITTMPTHGRDNAETAVSQPHDSIFYFSTAKIGDYHALAANYYIPIERKMAIITISALNVVMPSPHNAQRYIDLFQRSYKRKHPVKIWGDYAGMLGSCRVEEMNAQNIVIGDFYKFFDLNLDGQWLNTLEEKAAENTELAEIHIPTHLKPHFEIFPFIFFPNNHRLFFITTDQHDNFSPSSAQKLLIGVFDDLKLFREFGEIEVIVEPSTETLEQIFSMPRLKKLYIEVTPPNPDDHEEAEQRLFEKMGIIGADKQTIELVSKKPLGLKPDPEIKTLAKIAQSNGKVSGHGEDNFGQTINVSTAEHPMKEKVEFNSTIQTRLEALKSKALDLLRNIIHRR